MMKPCDEALFNTSQFIPGYCRDLHVHRTPPVLSTAFKESIQAPFHATSVRNFHNARVHNTRVGHDIPEDGDKC